MAWSNFKRLAFGWVIAAIAVLSSNAIAGLALRPSGLVYDDLLNVTWLRDANLAATNTFGVSGINSDGSMNWLTARSWVKAMNDSNYLGYSDWRLPTIVDTGTPGCNWSFVGTDCGRNVDPSSGEMAHLYYVGLGNISNLDTNGNLVPGVEGTGWGLVNTGPFLNIQNYSYWYGDASISPAFAGEIWVFTNYGGIQYEDPPDLNFFAWALRDGDAKSVPEPATYQLIAACLLLVAFGKARRFLVA